MTSSGYLYLNTLLFTDASLHWQVHALIQILLFCVVIVAVGESLVLVIIILFVDDLRIRIALSVIVLRLSPCRRRLVNNLARRVKTMDENFLTDCFAVVFVILIALIILNATFIEGHLHAHQVTRSLLRLLCLGA